VLGIDRGGEQTKLGITYPTARGTSDFIPILVSTGKDNLEQLSTLTQLSLFILEGDSEQFPSYAAVLQHIVNSQSAFLNGDWNGINAITGLSGPGSTWGCFCCLTTNTDRLSIGQYRDPFQHFFNVSYISHGGQAAPYLNNSMISVPLFNVQHDRIVPLPLHIFLGIANLIVCQIYVKWVGLDFIKELFAQIKSSKVNGLSSVFNLTGPELSKWIAKDFCSQVASKLKLSPSPRSRSHRIVFLSSWIRQLHHFLLHSGHWTPEEVKAFDSLQKEIWEHWEFATGRKPTPKVHMLAHAVEFARRFRVLGRYSEAQMESCHAEFNRAWDHTHRNLTQNPEERLRRSHVSVMLKHFGAHP
jgi:hypothetical protein